MSTYFITAIDTDVGKTVVTGLLAKYLKNKQVDVITMKLAQTGCELVSDDIKIHRHLMHEELREVDYNGGTCPYLFKFPASPHLAAQMEGKKIDCDVLLNSISTLEKQYNTLLIEGVGGLMVPINPDVLLSDFLQKNQWPVVMVSSGRLGSINHTLLSLEVMQKRGIPLYGMIYNHYPITEPEITKDSSQVLKKYLMDYFPNAKWGEVSYVDVEDDKQGLNLENWFETNSKTSIV